MRQTALHGAHWVWSICEELFPQAIQIVDIFHAKQKLWDVGKALCDAQTGLTAQLVKNHSPNLMQAMSK